MQGDGFRVGLPSPGAQGLPQDHSNGGLFPAEPGGRFRPGCFLCCSVQVSVAHLEHVDTYFPAPCLQDEMQLLRQMILSFLEEASSQGIRYCPLRKGHSCLFAGKGEGELQNILTRLW